MQVLSLYMFDKVILMVLFCTSQTNRLAFQGYNRFYAIISSYFSIWNMSDDQIYPLDNTKQFSLEPPTSSACPDYAWCVTHFEKLQNQVG